MIGRDERDPKITTLRVERRLAGVVFHSRQDFNNELAHFCDFEIAISGYMIASDPLG
jgi:hypothetical protein